MSKVWIINHYATQMYFQRDGRHYFFAKYLIESGHEVEIFCSNKRHNSTDKISVSIFKDYTSKLIDRITFNFIKTFAQDKSIPLRLINIFSFTKRLKRVLKKRLIYDRPDVILASSVHPWTVKVSQEIGDIFNIKIISEFRDLWPESLIVYGIINKNSLIAKYFYNLEARLYKNASKLIFTMPFANMYFNENPYTQKLILDKKAYYISNGFDTKNHNKNLKEHSWVYPIKDSNKIRISYVGSIRKANGVENILDLAKKVQSVSSLIIFQIFGEGDYKNKLEKKARKMGLKNVKFKGFIEKKYVPSILQNSHYTYFYFRNSKLLNYGISLNKLFDYFASGRPIITNIDLSKLDYFPTEFFLHQNTIDWEKCSYNGVNLVDYSKKIQSNNSIDYLKEYDYKFLAKKLEKLLFGI